MGWWCCLQELCPSGTKPNSFVISGVHFFFALPYIKTTKHFQLFFSDILVSKWSLEKWAGTKNGPYRPATDVRNTFYDHYLLQSPIKLFSTFLLIPRVRAIFRIEVKIVLTRCQSFQLNWNNLAVYGSFHDIQIFFQEPEKKKNFVNDTIRSDFHRRFMYKYIK